MIYMYKKPEIFKEMIQQQGIQLQIKLVLDN